MKQIHTLNDMRDLRRSWTNVGFVPTMGALHAGHLALVERAKAECDRVVVSIFVNPTQFNDPQDLQNYPQPLEQDLALLRKANVDAVLLPRREELYADGYRYELREKDLSQKLCGRTRPGHFEGVLTVVMKLFQMVQPDRAYFGEKDYQQLQLIRGMVEAFFLPIEIVPCPTVREADGLAMSSRNTRLTVEQRERAPLLYKVLKNAPDPEHGRRELERLGFRVDYFEEHAGRRYAAAFSGAVRLIDNVAL